MKYLHLLLIGMMLVPSAFADDSISVNFTSSTWVYHNQLSSSSISVAGYAVADNWNEINQPSSSTVVSDLIDSNGNTTGAVITFNNDYSWYVTNNINSDPGAVHELNKNAVRIANADAGHNTGSAEKELLRVDGIPYKEYTLVAYVSTHASGKQSKITVGGTSYYYTNANSYDLEQRFFDGTDPWLIASGTTAGDYSQNANIAVFPGLTDSTVVVTFDAISGNAGLNAIQIVERDPADWPDPYRGQGLVEVDSTLSWKAPVTFDPSGYDVYLGTDQALVAAGDSSVREAQGQPGTSLTPAVNLDPGIPYYWRVDAIDPNDGNPVTIEGYVLDFTTKPATPLIEVDPASVTVAAGTAADFDVSGLNFENYQWYHSTDASNATPGDDTEVGGNSATYTVTAELPTEGWYFCVVTNSAPGTDTSEVARLMTKRLVGWWKLEDDSLVDSVGTVVTGAPVHDGTTTNTDPSFVTGKDGMAVSLVVSQDPNDMIIISNSGDYFDFYPQGLTMSAWINTNDDGYGAYVAKQDKSSGNKGILLSHFYNNASFNARQTANLENEVVNIRDGGWHLITATLDPDTLKAKLYVDGKRYAGDEVDWNPAAMTLHDEPLFFGAETADGSVPFDGLLDDVRIYSYALDPVDVALMYIVLNPGATICIEDIAIAAGDLDGNCEVNLLDLVMLAADWVNCMIVPDCLP